jgi:tetratricopeptide (TPR) repeat protein
LGSDHPDIAESQNNLAAVYVDQGRYADAEPLLQQSLAIREKALGSDHPDVAQSQNNLAGLYHAQGRYTDAEPLIKRALAVREKTLGLDHPRVAQSMNNLAAFYYTLGRYADALPLVRTVARKGFDRKDVYLPILNGAISQSLLTKADALKESYQVIQRTTSSAASNAINQLSVRFAAGTDELAKLVRGEQDLSVESAKLDHLLITAISKEPGKRDPTNEQRLRYRLTSIAAERAGIQTRLNDQFQEFAALSKPVPTSMDHTQSLLENDEVLVFVDVDTNSYAWVITRTNADWIELKVSAKTLNEQVKALRASLTFDIDTPFDTQMAYKVYQETFGTIAGKLQGKKRLSVVTNGALTSLPLQLLITKDPTGL